MRHWPLALVALVLLAPPASAHAEFKSSDPGPGARLPEAPPSVSVTLTEPVDAAGTSLTVTDTTGARFDQGSIRLQAGDNPTLSIDLEADMPPGVYTILWRALSGADGHPSQGTVGFAIGNYTASGAASLSAGKVDFRSSVARFIGYAGFSIAFAAVAFLFWMRPAGYPTRPARLGLAVGATLHLAGVLLFMATTAEASGVPIADLGASEVGRVLLLRVAAGIASWLLALVVALGAMPARLHLAATGMATGLLLVSALGSSRLGHPYAVGSLTMVLDFVHLVAAAVWVGGLAIILWFLARGARSTVPPEVVRTLGLRFGRLAVACVVALAATGVIVAFDIVGLETILDADRLFRSPYGWFLAAKVALALLMVTLAGVNRYVLLAHPAESGLAGALQRSARFATRNRLRPGLDDARQFRATLAAEASLGAVVLLVAGMLASTSPPPEPEASLEDLHLYQEGRAYGVNASFLPAPGLGQGSFIHLAIQDLQTGEPLKGNTCGSEACVRLTLAYEGLNGTEPHVAIPAGGIWLVHDILWARPGNATIEVAISSADVYKDVVAFPIEVRT